MNVDVIPRAITERVHEALADTPVVVINGARQVGKSTLVRGFAYPGSAEVVTFDDPLVRAAAQRDPRGFLQRDVGTLVIDEAQLVPEIFRVVKAEVDLDRRPGRFILTGSSRLLAAPDMADSLVGRVEVLELSPFTQGANVREFAYNGLGQCVQCDQGDSHLVFTCDSLGHQLSEHHNGYGVTRMAVKSASPLATYKSQLAAFGPGFESLSLPARQQAVKDSIAAANITALPQAPTGQHIATDLMAFWFRSAEATDFCYQRSIRRYDCRGFQSAGQQPPPLKG